MKTLLLIAGLLFSAGGWGQCPQPGKISVDVMGDSARVGFDAPQARNCQLRIKRVDSVSWGLLMGRTDFFVVRDLTQGKWEVQLLSLCAGGVSGWTASVVFEVQPLAVLTGKAQVGVYPNPFDNELHLGSWTKWRVYAATGSLCAQGEGETANLSALRAGVYVVQTASGRREVLVKN